MGNLDKLTIKIKHNNNPEGLIESSVFAIRYLTLHKKIIVDTIFPQVGYRYDESSPNKEDNGSLENEYYIFSESLDKDTIDDLIVFSKRWEEYIVKVLNDLQSRDVLKYRPFSQMKEVTDVFSGLHDSVSGLKLAALKVTATYIKGLTEVIFLIMDKIKTEKGISEDQYQKIVDKIYNNTDDRKPQEIDKNLEERGVSLGWGSEDKDSGGEITNDGEEKEKA